MKLKTFLFLLMILAVFSIQVGCGKKGPPVPPLEIDKPENPA